MPDLTAHDEAFLRLAEHLRSLIQEIEQDPTTDSRVQELLHHTLTLYGVALRRIMELVKASPSGDLLLGRMTGDEIIRAILLIHSLFPVELETRVRSALDGVRPQLQAQGGDVEFLGLEDSVVRLRLVGKGREFEAATPGMRQQLEQALAEVAPDLLGVVVEGVVGSEPPARSARLVQIAGSAGGDFASGRWVQVIRLEEIPPGRMKAVESNGGSIVVAHDGEQIHACRNVCAHQQLPLEKGLLRGSILTCPWHGYQYDLRRGGACLADPQLRLERLPVLVEDGYIKVRY